MFVNLLYKEEAEMMLYSNKHGKSNQVLVITLFAFFIFVNLRTMITAPRHKYMHVSLSVF